MKGQTNMKRKLTALILCILLLTGCRGNDLNPDAGGMSGGPPHGGAGGGKAPESQGDVTDLGDDDTSYGDSLDDIGSYDGFFEEESADFEVICVEGTKDACKLEGTTLTFTEIAEKSVYSISGKFSGNIVIDVGDSYKFDLELTGFSMVCDYTNPITVISGDEVSIKAKSATENYIYDTREAIDETDEALHSAAIHSEVDLEIAGKGSLSVISENNKGIHSKDDLQVKNLTLTVASVDNALKGNDSVEITDGNTTLIATRGDSVKTQNSDISEKGNQRGTVSIAGGTHNIYAACDGIDAAYNVIIEGDATVVNIYTDKYSNYSEEVTAVSASDYYIRHTSQNYSYSVKFTRSDGEEYQWVNAVYHSEARGGRYTYYYYSFPNPEGFDKMQFFVYSSGMEQGQETDYAAASDVMTVSTSYDTIALMGSSYSWTNYTTSVQGGGFGGPGGFGGGMQEGNSDKGDYSTKGIKAANGVVINGGTVNIKSYDDAIHANCDTALENGAIPSGGVTVNGGNVTAYSNDDGLHADGTLSITGGTVSVTNSYEGLEGSTVNISGGYVSVIAKDDGINSTVTSGTGVSVSGGTLYVYCSGDGIDSNSRTSYSGILFSGGRTVVISTSGGNSAIDTEQGYGYTGGAVIAVMPSGGMSSEATHCRSFSSVGKSTRISLASGSYLTVEVESNVATVKMPVSMSALVVVLGDTSPSVTAESSASAELDSNGVSWN